MALKSNKQKPSTQFYSDFMEKFHNREVTKNYYKTIPAFRAGANAIQLIQLVQKWMRQRGAFQRRERPCESTDGCVYSRGPASPVAHISLQRK